MRNNKIYRFLTSIRLAIVLLIILALLCAVYTIVPQNQSEQIYIEQYGAGGAKIIQLFGFHRVMNSFWMYLTSILFTINLVLCTHRRFRWAIVLSKQKIRWYAWGSPILHVGLCITLLGSIMSVSMGHQIYYEIPVGKTAKVSGKSGTFQLQVKDFAIEYYEDEVTPKQYISDMVMTAEDGTETVLVTKVNSPAKYDGLKIIQQAYGWETTVTLSSGTASQQVQIKDDQWVTLFGEGENAVSLGIAFYPDYAEVDGQAQLMSNRDNNPYLLYVLKEGDTPVASDVMALKETKPIMNGLDITFDGYDYYTGLQMKYDPGIPVIFGGFFLICLGLAMRYALKEKTEQEKEKMK